ncbi:hypothetical protein [Candidatus Electronema sp. TJ]|uniref:hypothetical protein n=1 Tax=Candidatus Electronema sp. TJ TaxID=3401573 RepID=UPI003AA98444
MTHLLRTAVLLCFVSLPVLAAAAPPEPAAKASKNQPPAAQAKPAAVKKTKAQAQPVTVVLPESALFQTLSSLLPLPLEHSASQQLQGSVTVDSISRLSVDNGRIIVSGQLSGRNMSMNADVGGQSIQVRLGSLTLPVTCETALRFDPAKQLLLLTPRFQRSAHGNGDADEPLLALLNSLSKQYEVPLRNFMPISGEIGSAKVLLRMEPIDIRAEDGAVTLRLRPVAGKQP